VGITVTIHQIPRHHQLGLTDEQALEMYEYMLLARRFDERAILLQRAGKIVFHISGIGQETAQVAAAFAMKKQHDYFLPYYRDYGFVLALGMTTKDLMLSLFSKAEDPNSGGRQMSAHFGYKKHHIVTGSSPVATQVPHAVGLALSFKMKKQDRIAFVTFGEGSSNQGDVHEAFNFAGVYRLPVIFMCENNQYAISIPAHKQVAGKVADRAAGYGFPGIRVDGNDILEVYRVVKEAKERALRGEGPTLIEAMLYRISPHSTADDDMVYRSKTEVDLHKQKDGIKQYRQYLFECGLLNEEMERTLNEKIMQEMNEATSYAEQAAYPKPEDTLLHVYDSRTELPTNRNPSKEVGFNRGKNSRFPSPAVRKEVPAQDVSPVPEAGISPAVPGVQQGWMTVEADVSNLIRLHDKHKEVFRQSEGVQLTLVPFFLKAVLNSIKEYPMMNAIWASESIMIKQEVHLTLTFDSGNSLVTSIIKHADRKSIAGYAFELEAAVKNANGANPSYTNKSEGTFTVKVSGAMGSVISYPMIQQPQLASLSFESIIQRSVLINDMLANRSMINLCLSFDQRILDETICSKFLQCIKTNVEEYDLETLIY
jgi:2-oxoisovalerate dehydrogenase E1 component alpha subunit